MKFLHTFRQHWQILVIALVIGISLTLRFWPAAAAGTERFFLAGRSVDLYIARTAEEQFVGLGGRESLDGADGMLFVFDAPAKYGFVMRDMQFPIDIVWIRAGEVIDIAPNVPIVPEAKTEQDFPVYSPRLPADMVVELSAGWAEKHRLKLGDRFSVDEL